MDKPKLVVLGLDGMPFSLMKALLEAYSNKFPYLFNLHSTGTLRKLISVTPTISPAAWASAFTGKPPQVHGILDFWLLKKENNNSYKLIPSNELHLKAEPLWASERLAHVKKLVINVPPWAALKRYPRTITISSFPSTILRTNPSYVKPILLKHGYKIMPTLFVRLIKQGLYETALKELVNIEEKRLNTFMLLHKTFHTELNVCVSMFTDLFLHYFYDIIAFQVGLTNEIAKRNNVQLKQMIPLLGKTFFKFMKKVDIMLNDFRRNGHHIVVLSDHGMRPRPLALYPNSILQEQGLLRLKQELKSKLAIKILSRALDTVITSLGGNIASRVIKIIPGSLIERIKLKRSIDFDPNIIESGTKVFAFNTLMPNIILAVTEANSRDDSIKDLLHSLRSLFKKFTKEELLLFKQKDSIITVFTLEDKYVASSKISQRVVGLSERVADHEVEGLIIVDDSTNWNVKSPLRIIDVKSIILNNLILLFN